MNPQNDDRRKHFRREILRAVLCLDGKPHICGVDIFAALFGKIRYPKWEISQFQIEAEIAWLLRRGYLEGNQIDFSISDDGIAALSGICRPAGRIA